MNTTQTKYIRELRFGPPKCYKTGSIVSTYPRPLLCLEFDQEGLDVVKDPIRMIKVDDLESFTKQPALEPLIYAIDFCDLSQQLMTEAYAPNGNSKQFNDFVKVVNILVKSGCPFKTVVVDSLSGVGDSILAHIAATSPSSLASALKWAPMIGGKIYQCIRVITSLNTNAVFIMHSSAPQKDETTSTVDISPLLPSQWARDRVGTLVSQYLYQCKEGGKPIVFTTDQIYVKGIGCRWPSNLPAKIEPTFTAIYGKEPNVYK